MLDVPVIITRRRTSRLSMRIGKDGSVRVSAPWLTSRRAIEEFVSSHEDWIEQALVRTAAKRSASEAFYSGLDISTPAKRKEAAGRLAAIVEPMLESHAAEMGVEPASVSFRATKTRWGSCNPKTRSLNLSLYLLLLPPWCIEHVVVHELAHLLVPNHSRRFYAVMDRHFPRWRDARRETRRRAHSRSEEGRHPCQGTGKARAQERRSCRPEWRTAEASEP